MDIYELSEFAVEKSPMHPRLSLRGGDKHSYVKPHIAIDCYVLKNGVAFDIDDYERSFLYVTIPEYTKKGWKKAYRHARVVKSYVVAKSLDNVGV